MKYIALHVGNEPGLTIFRRGDNVECTKLGEESWYWQRWTILGRYTGVENHEEMEPDGPTTRVYELVIPPPAADTMTTASVLYGFLEETGQEASIVGERSLPQVGYVQDLKWV